MNNLLNEIILADKNEALNPDQIDLSNHKTNNQEVGTQTKNEFIDEQQVDMTIKILNQTKDSRYRIIKEPLYRLPRFGVQMVSLLTFLLIQVIIIGSFSLVYAILFMLFCSDDSYNNECNNDTLKRWGYSCGYLNIVFLAYLYLYKTLEAYFIKKNHPYYNSMEVITLFVGITKIMAMFVISIGLAVNDDSSCGQLHKLSMSYYIICFITIGILIVVYLIIGCISIYEKIKMR